MLDNHTDLRVIRTRKNLHEALKALLQHQKLEHITVNDIAKKAMVNRSTFYAHYTDKYDLLYQCVVEEFDKYIPNIPTLPENQATEMAPSIIEQIVSVINYIADNHVFFLKIVDLLEIPAINQRFKSYFEQLLMGYLKTFRTEPDNVFVPNRVLAHFLSSGYMSLVTDWLRHGQPLSTDTIAQQIFILTKSMVIGLQQYRLSAKTN